jgi:hypothetical protein
LERFRCGDGDDGDRSRFEDDDGAGFGTLEEDELRLRCLLLRSGSSLLALFPLPPLVVRLVLGVGGAGECVLLDFDSRLPDTAGGVVGSCRGAFDVELLLLCASTKS